MVIMAGWLPDPHVPVGAMAVAMNVFSLVTMLPMAFNIAGATRVGNELGENILTSFRSLEKTILINIRHWGRHEGNFRCSDVTRSV